MFLRHLAKSVDQALSAQAAVALLGPRQVGKTTLALEIGRARNALYLDLETPEDRDKLAGGLEYLRANSGRLIILDEIQRVPELFLGLRGLIDEGRRQGLRTGRFLLLGSASLELLRQSGESLAGRIRHLELTGLTVQETPDEPQDKLWLRGGYPESLSAASDAVSLDWRRDMVRTYLERDVPMLGSRVPAETLRRFWTMLAHGHGGLFNASRLAVNLEVGSQAISRYADLLVDLLLVRRLQTYTVNVGKRQVKSPKLYVRDTGLLHALLNVADSHALAGHPIIGLSWEGFVIENLLAAAPVSTVPGFYRTSGGAEIDLVLELQGGERWAIEIKRSRAAKPARGFHAACEDLQPARRFVVHAGADAYALDARTEVLGLRQMCEMLEKLEN